MNQIMNQFLYRGHHIAVDVTTDLIEVYVDSRLLAKGEFLQIRELLEKAKLYVDRLTGFV